MLTGLVPLALVVATSPLTVIPAVLVLSAPRPRPTSLAFLGGWLLGLAAVTGLCVAISGVVGGLERTPPAWASWLRVVVGSGLVVFGVLRWLTRHRHSEMPRWMRTFTNFTPLRAGITGLVLVVVRLEVLIISAAAGFAIGSSGRGAAGSWVATAFYVALAGSTVAIPILGYVAAGDRLNDALERLKDWMEKNHAGMLGVVLVLIGLLVLYNGIHAL